MPEPMMPLPDVATLDELLDRARRGVAAGTALDEVKNELNQQRNDLYYKLLNAPDKDVLGLRGELKAIEKLAKSLLVKEVQGEQARQQLMKMVGKTEGPKPAMLRPETSPTSRRHRRASGTTAK